MRPAAMVGRRLICKRIIGFDACVVLVTLMLVLAPLLPALAAGEQNIEVLAAQLEELKRLIEAQKTRDETSPELVVEAPREVDATEDVYRIAGDDHENPVIYIDGQVIALAVPGDGAPNLGPYTYAFSYDVAIAGEAENSHLVEAVDAAGNPIADAVFPLAVFRGTTRSERDRFFEEIRSYASRKMITSRTQMPEADGSGLGECSAFADGLLAMLEDNQDSYIASKQLYDKLARVLVGAEGLSPEWGTISDAGDEGSCEFMFIRRANPLGSGE